MLDTALLILRFSGLYMALAHGLGKVMSLATGDTRFIAAVAEILPFPGLFAWAAALAELVGGLLVFLGLGTRSAAALCAITMVVAAFGRHHAHQHLLNAVGLQRASAENLKAWGNPELALVYLMPFLALAFVGGGRFSLERAFRKGRR